MKKALFVALVGLISLGANGQAQRYFNFGGLGTGIYGGLEFPIATPISIGPAIYTDYSFNNIDLAVKANFYFDDLFGLPSEWDVYGGLNAGFRIDNDDEGDDDGIHPGAQIGARWFWNDKWGLNLEFGGGAGVNGGIGVTMKF